MKERIYTIPINEAFDQKTECPLCVCEKRLENDALEYAIGPAMMEPDCRIETNRTGFCANHFAKLYNLQKNRLPLALVIDTHMAEQIKDIEEIYLKHEKEINSLQNKGHLEAFSENIKGRKSAAGKVIEELLSKLTTLKSTCAVCKKTNDNMDRLLDNTLYLYKKEPQFKRKFNESKGFCLKHVEGLLIKAREVFSPATQAEFLTELLPLELSELKRINEEVNYFTKMFDYRNSEADWKNSKDALPRSIEKLTGTGELKR
ncbi:MAG: DUF6062 family protein [Acetivibrionales bacterium]|jgi:hypothetical protein